MAGPRVMIAEPNDANNRVFDANCPLEGMMFFDDQREKLVIKSEIFQKLTSLTEVAGAYFHEALYKTMRTEELEGGRNSVLTRILVGCLFAQYDLGSCLNLKAISLPRDRKVWRCEVLADADEPALNFWAYKESEGDQDWQIRPTRLGSASFGFELQGKLEKIPVTLPSNEEPEPGTGGLGLVTNSFRITVWRNWACPGTLPNPRTDQISSR